MAASTEEKTSPFGIVLCVLTFLAIYSVDLCNSEENFTDDENNYRFQSLFRTLLTDLHGYETNIHRCMFLANRSQNSQCLNSQVNSQTYFFFPSVSKALESKCASEDIYSCMQSDSFVKGVVGIMEEDISKTVNDVCCFLAQCGNCEIRISEIENNHATVPTKRMVSNGDCYEGCINCSHSLGINGTKTFRRINVLQNMTCTNKTFNNFPCTELNIIALNMLSTLASSKLLEDAKDMIKHCNPGFVEDPARTLSAMIKTPTDDEISNVKNFFSSDTVAPQPIHLQPKIQKGPGKVIGIVFLFVVVIASLVITGWLIRTRIFNSHSRTTNFSNVLYSRIDYDHENLDDYSDDDDDKGELSMFERA